MCAAYLSTVGGKTFLLNNINSTGAGSYWYDLFPACLYFQIAAHYPDSAATANMRTIADSWLACLSAIHNDFDHAGLDLRTRRPIDRAWREPDAAVGIAYLEYLAFNRFHDDKYRTTAENCLSDYEHRPDNSLYEVLGYYAPLLAARMNAEQGRNFDLDRELRWIFSSTSSARPGWGCIAGRWGDYDANGLMGSTTDTDGYAFAMNTFVAAGALAPVARYAPQYSRCLGRYLLAVAANANLFYPDSLPATHQSNSAWSNATGITCVSYEGVRHRGVTVPYATGDTHSPVTNFTPYGAWGVGILAALFTATDIPQIPQIDCLATDPFHGPANPTFLLYNPFRTPTTVRFDPHLPNAANRQFSLFDAVSGQYLARHAPSGIQAIRIPADSAVQIIVIP